MKEFKDLKFRKREGIGCGAHHEFDNGLTLSVQAGRGIYSTPREDISSPDGFSSFEVAIWDADGKWITNDFIPNSNDGTAGWRSRASIDSLITKLNKYV